MDHFKTIGTTIAENNFRNTTDSFWFRVNQNVIVNPFDIVSVPNALGTLTVGMVKESEALSISSFENNDNRTCSILARVVPMANTGLKDNFSRYVAVEMPVGVDRPVRFASKKEVLFALGVPKMQSPILLGVVEMSSGLKVPVSLDVSYILGPDTAHVNAAGVSGTNKTTYLLFLLQSTYQRLKQDGDSVAVIIFNTKEEDLLHIHEKGRVKNKHKKVFSKLGLEVEPFDNVTYFLPRGIDGEPNSAFIPSNSMTYSFELKDVYDRLDLLFPKTQATNHSMTSIFNFIYETWPLPGNVETWTDLSQFRSYPPEVVPDRSSMLEFLENVLRIRKSPLFIDRKSTSIYLGTKVREIRNKDFFVIDLARVPSLEQQAFIVGDVMKCIDDLYSRRVATNNPDRKNGRRKNLAPKYLLIFIDELNRFVPKLPFGIQMPPVADLIVRTIIAGRSRGTILFSAQQFKSTVNQIVHENIGMHVTAKVGFPELFTSSPYASIDENTRARITMLNKGEMVLIHPTFRQPIKIVFPKTPLKV